MTLLRPVVALVVAGCLLSSPALKADGPAVATAPASPAGPVYTPSKQFAADQVVTMKNGQTISMHMVTDNGKARTEMTMQGMNMVSIIRPDQQKIYQVMPAQKMVMVMPLNEKLTAQIKAAEGDDSQFVPVGLDSVDGVVCTKYQVTDKSGQTFYWWVDSTKKVPVKMAAGDGSMTVVWKNYVSGPQDAALFEPPADYQTMQMPSVPGMGGGAAAPDGGAGQ